MSFDRLAPHYRWMELVLAGGKLQHFRTAFLPEVAASRNVLILGEGNGRFLAPCRRALASARITCIDSSSQMLRLARCRLSGLGLNEENIDFVRADALEWSPSPRSFDLIVTHFFLDCFRVDQLQSLIAGIAVAALPHAFWLVADFQVPGPVLIRWRALAAHWIMYRFFRIVTQLPANRWSPPDAILEHHGFVLRERKVGDWGLLRSDLWQFKERAVIPARPQGTQGP